MNRYARGFTLLEMLVAVAILAVLAAATYRGLTVVLESRAAIERESERWRAIAMLFARLEQDLAAVAPRAVRDPAGHTLPALAGNPAAGPNDAALALTRFGAADAPDEHPAPLRIGYRVRADTVELLSWDALDTVARSRATVRPLLGEVRALELRYLDERNAWLPAWPRPDVVDPAVLPAAVEVRLVLAGGERVTRLFAVLARGTPQ